MAQKYAIEGCQADRIIKKFGRPRDLAKALDLLAAKENNDAIRRNATTVYRWTYSRDRGGTGGIIPTSAMNDVKRAARLQGILLTAEDWYG